MIGFIGLGAAGGNLADEAVKRGFPGIAINYSQKDLDSLEHVVERLKLVGSEGVGKNRDEAIRLMSKNWESAATFVEENFSSPSTEVIFVCFSTGGGSGGGMAPILLEILMSQMPQKTFVAVPILPDLSEVAVNQMNCVKTSEELSNLNLFVLPLDNEQVRLQHPNFGKSRIFREANETFVELISMLESYTEKQSKNGVVDQKDLRTIFMTKGIGTISCVDVTRTTEGQIQLTENGVVQQIQNSWKNTIFSPIHYNRIVRAGVIFDGQEHLMEYMNLPRIFEDFESGMPIDLFEGYYTEANGRVLTVLGGLSWYNHRLQKIEKIIEEKQTAAEELLGDTDSYEAKVNDFSATMRRTEMKSVVKKDTKKRSVSDILSRYKR